MKLLVRFCLLIVLFLIVGYVALPQYRDAIGVAFPYLLLFLVCPMAMYFMMGNMGRSSDENRKKLDQKDE